MRWIAPALALACYLVTLSASAQAAEPTGEGLTHERWTSVLERIVDDGVVDYAALRARRGELDAYLHELESVDRARFRKLSRAERLAYWINAYNAYTIALVLDHWPLASIWNAAPLWKRPLGGPFTFDFIRLGHLAPELGKEKLSLDDIEQRILRTEFGDARIHFAIVCAARGCPPLSSHAYEAATLDTQLDTVARRFLADERKNRYQPDRGVLVVSPIFRWYEADFAALGGVPEVFRRYGPAAASAALPARNAPPKIEYSNYDWSLNGPSGGPTTAPVPGSSAPAGPLDSRGVLKEK